MDLFKLRIMDLFKLRVMETQVKVDSFKDFSLNMKMVVAIIIRLLWRAPIPINPKDLLQVVTQNLK